MYIYMTIQLYSIHLGRDAKSMGFTYPKIAVVRLKKQSLKNRIFHLYSFLHSFNIERKLKYYQPVKVADTL